MKRRALGLMMATVAALPVFVNAEENSVKIGDKTYSTLKEAVEAVEVCKEESCPTTTINVLENHETSGIVFESGKYLEIDLGGYTVTFKGPTVGSEGTKTQDMQILEGSTIVFKNGKFVSSDTESSKMFIQNYANLTLRDIEIDATNELNQYALSNNSGNVSILGNTSIKANQAAFDVYGYYTGSYVNGPQVTVNTTGTIEGTIEVNDDDASKATKELSLVIENINHIGEMVIKESLKDNVTIKAGSYTDEEAAEKLPVEEGSKVYEVETPEGDVKYVVATEDELEEKVYIAESVSGDEFNKEFAFDEMLKELEEEIKKIEDAGEEIPEEITEVKEMFLKLKKLMEGKTGVSAHNILYGSFIGDNVVTTEAEKQPGKKVKVTLDIPNTLEKVKEGYTRKYSVIRIHMNEIENADGSLNYDYEVVELNATDNGNGKVEFETDKFSTYILVYEDVEAATNPETSDGIALYMIIASISLIGLVSLLIAYAKKAKSC